MELKVKNKVFMIAAASKGLGYGIANELAKNGATVCIAARTKQDIESAAQNIMANTGAEVFPSVMDASKAESISNWTNEVIQKFNRIDGLLVNAGGPPPGNFDTFSDEEWQRAFELTLLSAVRMVRSVLPYMRTQGSGSILTITSISVKEPIDTLLLSNVMRSGVTSLVKSLANQLATENIRVNNLIPGRIDTDRVKNLDKTLATQQSKTMAEIKQGFEQQIPLGRYGTTEEFGRTGAFLLSDAASYITGASLAVDGGILKTVW
jgi:3-oxoacyl-[acyl-carrier protein] reductase